MSKRLCTSVSGSPSYRATIEGDFRGVAAVPLEIVESAGRCYTVV